MPKYPNIHVQLSGTDGNAYAILGAVQKGLRDGGVDKDECDTFYSEATSGDYNNVIQTAIRWVDIT